MHCGRKEKHMIINGVEEIIAEGTTLASYVRQKGYRMDRIAVERNGEIVPKSAYDGTVLAPNDKLEVVSFVGGG